MLLGLTIFLEVALLSFAAYLLWYLPRVLFILYPKKRQAAFGDIPDFEKIDPMVKNKRILYLSFYGSTFAVILLIDAAVIWISWVFGESAVQLEEVSLVACIVTPLIIFLGFHFGFGIIFWKLWKKINLGPKNKSEAVNNFLFFKQSWVSDQLIKKVTIKTVKVVPGIQADFPFEEKNETLKKSESFNRMEEALLFGKVPGRKYSQESASFFVSERAINFLEKLYRWRIKRLAKKKLNLEQYSWKLLQIFVAYLNKCANFVLIVKMSQYQPFVSLDGAPLPHLLALKTALLNNFFSYEQEFKNDLVKDKTANLN